MTPEERRGIAEFLKKYTGLIADFNVLYALLEAYESHRKVPSNWKKEWADLQQGPEYEAALKAFQPLIDGVERAKFLIVT